MPTLRPTGNSSYVAERLFGAGIGIVLASMVLGDGRNTNRSIIVAILGVVLILSSIAMNVHAKRRSIAEARANNARQAAAAIFKGKK